MAATTGAASATAAKAAPRIQPPGPKLSMTTFSKAPGAARPAAGPIAATPAPARPGALASARLPPARIAKAPGRVVAGIAAIGLVAGIAAPWAFENVVIESFG